MKKQVVKKTLALLLWINACLFFVAALKLRNCSVPDEAYHSLPQNLLPIDLNKCKRDVGYRP
jgi:hypothetical protein